MNIKIIKLLINFQKTLVNGIKLVDSMVIKKETIVRVIVHATVLPHVIFIFCPKVMKI